MTASAFRMPASFATASRDCAALFTLAAWAQQRAASGMRREHRAALAIQTAWRGHTARAEFLRYRRGVVAAQGLWRSKLARRKLRALRAEAREAGKLMQVRASCLQR